MTGKTVHIGRIELGGGSPVKIQSMVNVPLIKSTDCLSQARALATAGSSLVRFAVPSLNDVYYLEKIVHELKAGTEFPPVVADVHFNPDIAFRVAPIVDKIRINPGNFSNEKLSKSVSGNTIRKLKTLSAICKEHQTAIRIGANHGSLSPRINYLYGNTVKGLVESVMEYVRILHGLDFYELVVSIKSSDIHVMVDSNRLLAKSMKQEGLEYPVHLGLTEAGSKEEGIIRSALATGMLLSEGIGDTIRVSISGDPVEELPVASQIRDQALKYASLIRGLSSVHRKPAHPVVIITDDENELRHYQGEAFPWPSLTEKSYKTFTLDLATPELFLNIAEKIQHVNNPVVVFIKNGAHSNSARLVELSLVTGFLLSVNLIDGFYVPGLAAQTSAAIIQASGRKVFAPEYISCPSCGRTEVNIEQIAEEVKAKTRHLKGLKIAVMGCAVNGPGEMAGADYGILGAGKNRVHIYKGGNALIRNVEEKNAVEVFIAFLEKEINR